MPDVRTLIDSAQGKGLSLFLEGDKVKIRAPHTLDRETKALIQELREHKEQVRRILATPPCWNCDKTMTKDTDIYGETVFVCWSCATWA